MPKHSVRGPKGQFVRLFPKPQPQGREPADIVLWVLLALAGALLVANYFGTVKHWLGR